jgi:hypothetical protein
VREDKVTPEVSCREGAHHKVPAVIQIPVVAPVVVVPSYENLLKAIWFYISLVHLFISAHTDIAKVDENVRAIIYPLKAVCYKVLVSFQPVVLLKHDRVIKVSVGYYPDIQ